MFKHIKVSTASVLIIVGSILAVYSIPRDQINQWSAGTDALGLTLQTDGALVGQVDNANDLGSSNIEFKDAYIDGTAYIDTLSADAVTVSGNITVNGILLESVTTLGTGVLGGGGTTLTVAQAGYIVVDATSAVTLTLPAVSGNAGLSYTVINSSTASPGVLSVITLDGNASEKVDGSTTNTELDAYYDSLKITCDGTEWFITGGVLN